MKSKKKRPMKNIAEALKYRLEDEIREKLIEAMEEVNDTSQFATRNGMPKIVLNHLHKIFVTIQDLTQAGPIDDLEAIIADYLEDGTWYAG